MRALNPEQNAPQEHGKTADFKPADLRGFRNGADTQRDLYTSTCILHAENRVTGCLSLAKDQRLECFEMGVKWHF